MDEGGGELGLETERERLWRLLTEEVKSFDLVLCCSLCFFHCFCLFLCFVDDDT